MCVHSCAYIYMDSHEFIFVFVCAHICQYVWIRILLLSGQQLCCFLYTLWKQELNSTDFPSTYLWLASFQSWPSGPQTVAIGEEPTGRHHTLKALMKICKLSWLWGFSGCYLNDRDRKKGFLISLKVFYLVKRYIHEIT